jgi:Spy/CpxP family protein refolding chaperone
MPVNRRLILSSNRPLRTRLAALALALGAAWTAVPAAEAQFGGKSGMASLFTPDFLGRDLPVFVEALGLEEWQKPILEALLEDYETNFNTAADGVRSGMSQFRDVAAGANPERVVEMISQPLVNWAAEKRRLREDFLESVRGTLANDQSEQWPRLERALRREKSLPLGELSGESLDLTVVVRELRAPMSALEMTAEAMEAYEVALDAALASRDAELDASIAPLLKAMSSGDTGSGVASQERIMQWRVEVRNAQEAGIASIRTALGEEFGPDFERRAMQKAFPMVYRPDPVTPLLEGALALPDLTDAQRAQLETLSQEFTTEFDGVRGQLVAAYRETEPQEPRRRTELAKRRAAGEQTRLSDPPSVEQAKAAREELFTKYRLRITEILTSEQKQAVPGLVKADAEAQRKPVPGREQKLEEGQVPDGDVVEYVEGAKGGKGGGGKPAQPVNPASEGFGSSPGSGAPKRAD